MNVTSTTLKYLFGSVLLGAAASSVAVSLGRMRSATIVGRTFDATVVAQLNGNEALSSVCANADVLFGDTQLFPDRVRLTISQGANASEALIRIQSTVPVDEPVVTVFLREGCGQKNTRKYVLLAEVLSDNATQPAISTGESVASAPRLPAVQGGSIPVGPAPAGGSAGTANPDVPRITTPRVRTPRTAAVDPATGAATASAQAAPPAARPARPAAKAAPDTSRSTRARLKLEPLDLTIDHDPVLRASAELLSTPTTDEQQRLNAAALWQALNAQPADILRNNERLKSLESDVAKMLAQSRKTDGAITDLRAELAQSRGQRDGWLLYGLLTLIPLALLVAAFLWWRARRRDDEDEGGGPWWRRNADTFHHFEEPAGPAPASQPAMNPRTAPVTLGGRAPDAKVDLDLSVAPTPGGRKRKPETPPAPVSAFRSSGSRGHSGFSHSLSSVGGAARVVNAEELFDVQQQADFFLSLGNADKAVEVLRLHIADNVETSALAYLDLFDLYQSLGRREDYENLRNEFNPLFNAQVPPFDEYTQDTHGLEFYTSALSRIESLWPTPKVLDVIEESIFRRAGSGDESFSLAAYRELLLLHAIAKKVIERPAEKSRSASGRQAASGFDSTSLQPLSAEAASGRPESDATLSDGDLTRPPASPRLGLDIDLTEDFDDQPALVAPSFDIPTQAPTLPEFNLPATPEPAADSGHNLIEFELDPIDPPPPRSGS